MVRNLSVLFLTGFTSFFVFFIAIIPTFAAVRPFGECNPDNPALNQCDKDQLNFNYSCQRAFPPSPFKYACQRDVFGRVQPPAPLAGLIKDNPSGAWIISKFLSNFIALLFSIAAIALIFMILWGAFDWLTSGGDKEKLANAQKRLINAFIGIILFATAFAIIRVLGIFTGFTFFASQNAIIRFKASDGVYEYMCPNDNTLYRSEQPKCP